VFDDGLKDGLVGGKGTDWFVLGSLDTLDLKTGEQKLTVSPSLGASGSGPLKGSRRADPPLPP
jgi:hypothetical protein